MSDVIEQAGLHLAAARRHANACEVIANGIAWVAACAAVLLVVGYAMDPAEDVALLPAALLVALGGGALWALVRAAGLALHIRVDAVMVEAEDGA